MKAESEELEEPQKRSIILPMQVWKALGKDAKRCRRSVNKQIEAILVRVYNLETSVEIDEESLISGRQIVSHSRLQKAG